MVLAAAQGISLQMDMQTCVSLGLLPQSHGDLFLTVSTLEWVSVHYMHFICGLFLCTVPSSGDWSGRSSDTCALHSAVSSPVCQHTLDAAVHSYQQ